MSTETNPYDKRFSERVMLKRVSQLQLLPIGQRLTLAEAARIMGISKSNLRCNYLCRRSFPLPPWIEVKYYDSTRIEWIMRRADFVVSELA